MIFGRTALIVICAAVIATGCSSRKPAESKESLVQRGDQFVAKNQYVQAIDAYRRAADLDPSDGHVHMKLANAYIATQKWDDSLSEALRSAELLPDDRDAAMLAASRLLGNSHFLEALLRSSALLDKYPEDPEIILLSANATAHLLNSTWALYKMPDSVRSADDFAKARADIRPPVPAEDDMAAELLFKKALLRAPDSLDAQLAYVNFLWAAGRPDDAEPLLKKVADANPGHATANNALGTYYVFKNRPADAEVYLKNAAAAGVYGLSARMALADVYIADGRDADAVALLGSMPADKDADGSVTLRVAPAEFHIGRHASAIQRIEAFLARAPKHAEALLDHAQFLVADRRFDEAVPAARAAVAAADTAETRLVLGRALFGAGDLTHAYEEDTEAARLSPDAAPPQNELARVSLALGRDNEALQYANGGNVDALAMVVRAMIAAGDAPQADRLLEPFLPRFPDSATVLTSLGEVKAAEGDAASARKAFERALEKDARSFDALSGAVGLDLEQGSAADAQRRVDAAAATFKDDAAFLRLTARVSLARRDTAHAESTLWHALAVDRDDVETVVALGDVLAAEDRVPDAQKLLEENAKRKLSRGFEIETALGLLLERTGRAADARTRYAAIVAAHLNAGLASFRLATIITDHGGNLDTALSLAETARTALPDVDGSINGLIGRILLKMDAPGRAVRGFEQAVRRAPGNMSYHYGLGAALMKIGDEAGASAEYARALQAEHGTGSSGGGRLLLTSLP